MHLNSQEYAEDKAWAVFDKVLGRRFCRAFRCSKGVKTPCPDTIVIEMGKGCTSCRCMLSSSSPGLNEGRR